MQLAQAQHWTAKTVAARLVETLAAEEAFSPERSLPGPVLAELSGVPMAQFAQHASRVVAGGYVVMPIGRADGWLSGVWLCGDPAILEDAANNLQKQADRAAEAAAFYRGVAACARRRGNGETEDTELLGGGQGNGFRPADDKPAAEH